ncbi:hypothetical protein AnigIFM62618_006032 [Aspergillus niger]|nr:hypothetical protein AnigIFM62618_006032 [Aspergillus niger]
MKVLVAVSTTLRCAEVPLLSAAKEAGVKRFVPSEWVGPAPRGIIDLKDQKLKILGVIQRVGLRTLSSMLDVDFRFGYPRSHPFGLTDMVDIGKYVAQIISDARTLNRRVFAYTEVLSMNEIWDTMATVSGEIPPKDYVSEEDIGEIIRSCGKRWHEHGDRVDRMDVANYNMGQYRISFCIRGDNTPEFADYPGYLDFWKLFPDFPKGRSSLQPAGGMN